MTNYLYIMSEDTEKANLLAVGILDVLSPAVKEVDTKVNEVRYASLNSTA